MLVGDGYVTVDKVMSIETLGGLGDALLYTCRLDCVPHRGKG